jgi:hypothetical protein
MEGGGYSSSSSIFFPLENKKNAKLAMSRRCVTFKSARNDRNTNEMHVATLDRVSSRMKERDAIQAKTY